MISTAGSVSSGDDVSAFAALMLSVPALIATETTAAEEPGDYEKPTQNEHDPEVGPRCAATNPPNFSVSLILTKRAFKHD